jgi:hypothetical protein
MAAKLSSTELTALEALSNLEEQVIYVCQKLDAAQTTWNTTNPQFQRTAIDLNADFIGKTVAVQIALPLESSQFSAASVNEAFPVSGPV